MDEDDFETGDFIPEEEEEGDFKTPLGENEDAASDDDENELGSEPKRFRSDSESTTASDISTSSKFSILSNVSSLASGGIFEADRENEEETVRAEDMKQVGPEMGHVKGIKNKAMRTEEYLRLQRQKRKAKMKARKERAKARLETGEATPTKNTIESMRKVDETIVEADDAEVEWDEQNDELENYYNKEQTPKVLLMTRNAPRGPMTQMCREFLKSIPNSTYLMRHGFALKKLIPVAQKKGYTDLLILSADRKWVPNDLKLIHLTNGGLTAHFKMSSVKLRTRKEKAGRVNFKGGNPTNHWPELILNNFKTRLGRKVGRMFAAIFPQNPEFEGRQVVTFHNQRDYIFFRQHRYQFRNEKRCGLAELGPRFTLRLRSLQKGTFDSKYGEFEFELRRKEMDSEGHGYSKKKFFL